MTNRIGRSVSADDDQRAQRICCGTSASSIRPIFLSVTQMKSFTVTVKTTNNIYWMGWILGLLSLILKSLIKSLMPKAPVGASIRLLHSKGCC